MILMQHLNCVSFTLLVNLAAVTCPVGSIGNLQSTGCRCLAGYVSDKTNFEADDNVPGLYIYIYIYIIIIIKDSLMKNV